MIANNVKKSPKKNTKHVQRKQGPLQELEVGSGTMEELASFADWSHPPGALS